RADRRLRMAVCAHHDQKKIGGSTHMTTPGPRVRVVVINYNGAELTAACVASLSEQNWSPLDIVVVDAHSPDKDWEKLQKIVPCNVVLHRTEQSSGYARSINLGARLKDLPPAEFTLA